MTSFHEVLFPLDVALKSAGGPERRTDIVSFGSGREARNARWAQSRRRYDAGYGVKTLDALQAVVAFFEERRGRLGLHLRRHDRGRDISGWAHSAGGSGDNRRIQFRRAGAVRHRLPRGRSCDLRRRCDSENSAGGDPPVRSIPSELQTKLDSGATTLARCWIVVRR